MTFLRHQLFDIVGAPEKRPVAITNQELLVRTAGLVSSAPWMGNAYRHLPAHALDLLEEVALKTTEAASIRFDDIGALIVNTITVLAVPSLDAKLMNRLRLSRSVERLPIFGLGCGGGVGGLARAARYAQAVPVGALVLFLTIDLSSLCLRIADPSVAMFVAAALLAMGRREWCCATLTEQVAALGGAGCSPLAIISGQTPSKSWDGTSRRMGSGWF
jgi:alkylresorcinol/alkylpyrone synthase